MTDQEPPHNCADIALLVHQKCGAKFAALPAAHQTMFAEIVRTRKRRGDQVAWMRNMWLHLMHDGPLPSTFDTDTPLLFTAPTAPPKATRQMLAEVLFDARLMAGVRNWPIDALTVDSHEPGGDQLVFCPEYCIKRLFDGRSMTKARQKTLLALWKRLAEANVSYTTTTMVGADDVQE